MSQHRTASRGLLYIISCASRPAQRVPDFVQAAQAAGWDVGVIVTPQATKFVDCALLEHLTGYPVRSEYKRPEEPDVLPRADAIVVFPATFNTLNKWVLGISDTLALGVSSFCGSPSFRGMDELIEGEERQRVVLRWTW